MNDLTVFSYRDRPVRTIMVDGEPWWVAKDVVEAVGAVWKGGQAIIHIPDEWKVPRLNVTTFGEKETWFISEQGLYFYLMRSDKDAALPFQKWLAGEVLPSIRKTGSYTLPGSRRPMLESAKIELERLKAAVEKQESRADLVLAQFVLENFKITGVGKDKIGVKTAYELYCSYAEQPLSSKDFATNVCFAYPDVCFWHGNLTGLKRIKQKQG
jgi:prophage antirepressor-like protein